MFCCIVLYSVGYHWETTSVIILCRADVLQKASVSTIRNVRMELLVRKTSRITRTLATVHLLLPADIVSLVSRHYINTVTFGQLWAVSTGFLIKWSIDWLNDWLIESENCEIRLLTELKPLSRCQKLPWATMSARQPAMPNLVQFHPRGWRLLGKGTLFNSHFHMYTGIRFFLRTACRSEPWTDNDARWLTLRGITQWSNLWGFKIKLTFSTLYSPQNFQNFAQKMDRNYGPKITDTFTHTLTDANRFHNVSHSYGTDKNRDDYNK